MKIYFTASMHGRKYYLKNYRAIVDVLRSLGHKLFLNNLFDKETKEVWSQDKETSKKFCQRLSGWLKRCDLVVVEVSYPSTSLGIEITMALNSNKPALAIYATDKPAPILEGLEGEHLLVHKYGLETLRADLKNSLDYLEQRADTRFTMILPSDINSYLSEVADNRSGYIRRLIRQDMKERQGKNKK